MLGLLNYFRFQSKKLLKSSLAISKILTLKKFVLIVKMIASYYIIYTNRFHRPGIKATVKLIIFLLLPVPALNSTAHN